MPLETTQVIYSMNRVGRFVPPNKQILRDISLGFYYGAKIGVLGLNGAGKSTLLRIMAGVDPDYVGEIAMSKGYSVGMLEQEPRLDEAKTVIEVVREAVQPVVDMLKRFGEVSAKFAEPDADFDALANVRQGHSSERPPTIRRQQRPGDDRQVVHAGETADRPERPDAGRRRRHLR